MKKLLAVLLAAVMSMCLGACSCSNHTHPEPAPTAELQAAPTPEPEPVVAAAEPTAPAEEDPSDMQEFAIGSGGETLSDQLEVRIPELSQHGEAHTTVYVDSQSGATVTEETRAEDHRWQLMSDPDGHWKVCALCGETSEAERHSFDANGRCAICGYGCEHTFTDTVVAPTCTQMGYTRRICSVCGFACEADHTQATGHNYKGKVKTPAACTESGVMEYTCTRCGHKLNRSIPAKGHTPAIDPGEEATCRTEGRTQGTHCSVCGAVLTAQETIPVQDHRYENGSCVWCGEKEPSGTAEPSPSPTPMPPPVGGGNNELPEMPIG